MLGDLNRRLRGQTRVIPTGKKRKAESLVEHVQHSWDTDAGREQNREKNGKGQTAEGRAGYSMLEMETLLKA